MGKVRPKDFDAWKAVAKSAVTNDSGCVYKWIVEWYLEGKRIDELHCSVGVSVRNRMRKCGCKWSAQELDDFWSDLVVGVILDEVEQGNPMRAEVK